MRNQTLKLLLCGAFSCSSAYAQTAIDLFEYASDEDLSAAWVASGNTVLSMTNSVAAHATGSKALRADFFFPSGTWPTEIITGPVLEQPLSLSPDQFVSFRVKGDPAFAVSPFRYLYLYAFDDTQEHWGRWGLQVPATNEWQVYNFKVSDMQTTWDSPVLPDFSRIGQFKFYQYGGDDTPIAEYSATVLIDEVTIRTSPLTEFPAPSAARTLVDNFEKYASDTALTAAYSYLNSPAATTTTALLDSPAPEGSKALKFTINFASGQYPWGALMSQKGTPFSIPTNAVLLANFKGDPTLAATADEGTTFWISFYDNAGKNINFVFPKEIVTASDWTPIQLDFASLGDTSTVDIGNLVQWRILVQAWTGTADSAAATGTFQLDDIRLAVVPDEQGTPNLTIRRAAPKVEFNLVNLTAGRSYDVLTSADLKKWTTATSITATGTSSTWSITPDGTASFFRLSEK